MPVYPMPAQFTQQIAAKAAATARRRAPVAKHNSKGGAKSLYPVSAVGLVGVAAPASHRYMIYQEKGVKPRLMTELAGKTIPIRDASGQVHFRYVNPNSIGKTVPRRDASGEVIGTKLAWYFPGLPARNFMLDAIREEIKKFMESLDNQTKLAIAKEVPELKSYFDKAK